MPLNAQLVGKDYGEMSYEVTAEAIEKYARATNDLNERYLGGDVVASPVFAVVPAFPSFMAVATDPELEADFQRLVHGAEEHVLYEPIRPGDRLTIKTLLESVDQEGMSETFTIKSTETNQDGVAVAELRATMFIRGGRPSREAMGPAAEQGEREVVYEETSKVDEDQTQRYAEASGDYNPIHLDEEAAKAAGLPGIINQGMCTMALATKAAVDGLAGGDPLRVRQVGVRFSRPVFPGDELTTRLWRVGSVPGAPTYGFETYNARGKAVIKNGIVEIAEG